MSTPSLISVPSEGARIVPGRPVPDNPIIPFIEGDGIGVDITPVMQEVVDAAVAKAYGGGRRIYWLEVYAGEKSTRLYGPEVWMPDETLATVREYSVAIKGPMTTPVGGGIRSLNVTLRPPVRDRQRPPLGDPRPQGQRDEVHRGRLPRLGLCARRPRVRRDSARGRPLADLPEPGYRAGDHRQGRHHRRIPAADPASP